MFKFLQYHFFQVGATCDKQFGTSYFKTKANVLQSPIQYKKFVKAPEYLNNWYGEPKKKKAKQVLKLSSAPAAMNSNLRMGVDLR